MTENTVNTFPSGTHAQITGLASKPELNEKHCVSLGVNSGNPERVSVTLASGATIAVRPVNLKPTELLPGDRLVVVGLNNAQYNGKHGEVLSWQGERWIVDLDCEERKSFRRENLVIVPDSVCSRKRKIEEVEELVQPKVSAADLKDLAKDDEQVIGRALLRCVRQFPLVAQKCICCLATKQTVTVMHELAIHLTNKQCDGLLRRPLRPGEKVKGIEELDAMEQCVQIAERRLRALANMCRVNYLDLFGFIKQGLQEPKFKQRRI